MALALSDYKASNENSVYQMVIDQFRGSSWVLDNILFDDGANVTGSDTWVYQYDRVTTEPTAATRAVGAEYTAQESKTTAITTELKIFGGSANLDRTQFNTARYGSRIAFQINQKVKASRALFHDLFINGDSGTTATEFDGLDALITASSNEITSAIDVSTPALQNTNARAFAAELDEALDLVYGDMDDRWAIFGSRAVLRTVATIARNLGYYTESENAFGRRVRTYNGIPMIDLGNKPGGSSPIIATTAGTPDTSDLFIVRFGMDGVHGVSPSDSSAFINTYLPDVTTPGAVKKVEVEMVSAVALKDVGAAASLRAVQFQP